MGSAFGTGSISPEAKYHPNDIFEILTNFLTPIFVERKQKDVFCFKYILNRT